GLTVAENKTEAIFLHQKGKKPPQVHLRIGRVRVPVEAQMKYLGLILNGTWRFKEHFSRLAPRLKIISANLGKLMRNIGGPDMKARRLHAEIINSVALYDAPIWAEALAASRPLCAILRRAHRTVAVRVIRTYWTVSHVAATALAGMPPLELLAGWAIARRGAETLEAPGSTAPLPTMEWALARYKVWDEAVRLCLAEWAGRKTGTLTFRTTQVLTGHGCFGEYLCRIGKERTTQCHHCTADPHSAQHTPQDCLAWVAERGVVASEVRPDLSLPSFVNAMLGSERKWNPVTQFCETVIKKKEGAEEFRRQAEG
ncbi:Putative 115 kDa protein in type-1 retrotransposable element R1DM, partial [Harpegnathos saltator]